MWVPLVERERGGKEGVGHAHGREGKKLADGEAHAEKLGGARKWVEGVHAMPGEVKVAGVMDEIDDATEMNGGASRVCHALRVGGISWAKGASHWNQ